MSKVLKTQIAKKIRKIFLPYFSTKNKKNCAHLASKNSVSQKASFQIRLILRKMAKIRLKSKTAEKARLQKFFYTSLSRKKRYDQKSTLSSPNEIWQINSCIFCPLTANFRESICGQMKTNLIFLFVLRR